MKLVSHHRHPANVYASGPLDRMDNLRTDSAALESALQDSGSRLFPVWRGLNLVRLGVTLEGGWLNAEQLDLPSVAEEVVFLGQSTDGTAHFAIDLSHHDDPPPGKLSDPVPVLV